MKFPNLTTVATKIRTHFHNQWLVYAIATPILIASTTLQLQPTVGICVSAALIAGLLALSVLYIKAKKIALASAVIPAAYMVAASLPNTSYATKLAAIYGTILALSLIYRHWFMQEDDSPKHHHALPLKKYAQFVPQAVVAGQIIGAIAFLLSAHVQPFPEASMTILIGTSVAIALTEVIFFQGLIQSVASEVMSHKTAAILAAVLFIGLSSLASFDAFIISSISGATLAVFYYANKSLIPAMFLNIVIKLTFVGLIAAL